MSISARLLRSLAKTKGMRWFMIRAQRPLDEMFRGTKFMPSAVGGVDTPICFLTTTGRVSGEDRTVPLLYVTTEDGDFAVVASNYGQDHHPAWSHNLDTDPNGTIAIDEVARPVTARRADAGEQADLWPRFEAIWPGYETYRSITDRSIRMYVLTPQADEA